ncbi:MAG: calcium/sodium antiporter [Trueperaceae bacterium]|nr:calcium/sodium antiporter [Trueperaceae bacterium]
MLSFFFIVLGIGLLYLGGELLVRYASSLALRFNLSPLVIGLTVVAFGTSAPELAATLAASLSGASAIGIGNVIGSNTSNLGLILGLCAIILPLAGQGVLRRELPIMLFVSLLPFFWFWNGSMGRLDGLIGVSLLISYLIWTFRTAPAEANDLDKPHIAPLWLTLIGILGGLTLLVLGAQVLVEGASTLARAMGVPEKVIGLTLVAVGTSLPELASSVVAIIKRQTDLVLGNIIGSNIFNILGILGISSLVKSLPLSFELIRFDLIVMLGFALLTSLFLLSRKQLVRWEGGVLMAGYMGYIVYLF